MRCSCFTVIFTKMQVACLASLCHKKILCQHLRADPHITMEEHLTSLAARLASIDKHIHAETCEDLCVRQAKEQFWLMSTTKLEVMTVCECGRCGRQPFFQKLQPWTDRCQSQLSQTHTESHCDSHSQRKRFSPY